MRIWAWKDVGTAKFNVLFQNARKATEKYQRNKDTTESNGVKIGKRVLKYKKVNVQRLLQRISNRL
jgi:hypothetical protein